MKKIWSLFLVLIISMQVTYFPVSASDEAPFEIYTIQTSESSEYGYIDYKFVNENGDELNAEIVEDTSEEILFYSANLPSAYDSRDYGYVTSVKDQGSSGTCWAFASLSALESDSVIKNIDNVNTADYSEAHLVWFSKNSLVTDTTCLANGDGSTDTNPYSGTNSGGNWMYVTAALSRWSGLAEESDYPFYPTNLTSMGNYGESARYDTGSNIVLKSTEILVDETDIKQWITEHGSVTASYYSDDSYLNKNTYSYYCKKDETSNHLITIVGWDDTYEKKNFKLFKRPSGAGAWLCKNSWGSDWGLDGYFWISYEDASMGNFVGYTTQTADKFTNNYTYNGNGYSSQLTAGTSPETANVFKANSYEVISDIATYTLQTDTDLTISIYKNLPSDYTSPDDGDLAVSWKTNIARAGYHTICVPEEITLKPGTVFSVVVKMECSSGSPAIPVEADEGYSFNEGESFLNTGGGWSDVAEYSSYGLKNLCIQAFTKPILEHESGVYIDFRNKILITPVNALSYLKSNIDILGDAGFSVADCYGNTLGYGATGANLTVFENNVPSMECTVVVTGDLNGDGVCDVLDAAVTERGANGHGALSNLEIYAANGCVSDSVDISDYQNIVNKALSQ